MKRGFLEHNLPQNHKNLLDLVGKVETVDKWPLLVSNNTNNCDPLNGKIANLVDH